MIPVSIRLKGFLCYKEEQEIGFDGNTSLWMLTGLNGSGKSAIFDAVTFALFGHHRGGGQNAQELINKDSDALLVEFDFLLDGETYRIKRTLRRNTRGGASGTQQIFRRDGGDNGSTRWKPIEGTQSKREGFDPWVREKIGLDYDTFTSSVLLLQGRAEKLLDSKPEGRREVLASIVDLDRYERLFKLADEQRKDREIQLKALSLRLNALPAVREEEFAEIGARIEDAESARTESRQEVERLQALEFQSRNWIDLQQRISKAHQRWQEARALLEEADTIEQSLNRLKELRAVLPNLQVIVHNRGQMHSADSTIKELQILKQQAVEQVALRDNSVKQTRDKRSTMQSLLSADEQRHREVIEHLRKTAVAMEKLKECDRHEKDLSKLQVELANLPADLDKQLTQAREKVDELARIAQVIPLLNRLRGHREELREAMTTMQTAEETQKQVHAHGRKLVDEVDALRPKVEQADAALRKANDESTEARTLLQQARESLSAIEQIDGAKVCRHCGQELTEGHLQEERRRRRKDVDSAEARSRLAHAQVEKAKKAHHDLHEQMKQTELTLQEARDQWRDADARMKQAVRDVERLNKECNGLYAEVAEPYRTRISPHQPADWPATTYPEAADLERLQNETRLLDASRVQLREMEQQQQTWGRLKGQEVSLMQTLARLKKELPADHDQLRADHADLEVEQQTLEKNLAARRTDLKKLEADLDRQTREREQAQTQVSQHEARIKEQGLVRKHAEEAVEQMRKLLPETWLTDLDRVGTRKWSDWNQEMHNLEQSGIEQRGKELAQARANLDMLKKAWEELDARQQDFPEEARRFPDEVRTLLESARKHDAACEETLGQAKQQKALLDNYRKQRDEIGEECVRLEGDLNHYRILAELLGKDRLQLHLVRQAERQVVDYANAVLDRLSGGQLYLRLVGEAEGEGATSKALELEAYNRLTGEKPINVCFLSGSQKFRVAVSLALGIGQYASRQHRPIESVIIDEGFGCLDHNGRQVMIQELQNLRGQMRCILLVSHQEEFAEAFSDGYHFSLEDGATRIRRIQK